MKDLYRQRWESQKSQPKAKKAPVKQLQQAKVADANDESFSENELVKKDAKPEKQEVQPAAQ